MKIKKIYSGAEWGWGWAGRLVQDVTLSSPREGLDGLHHCSGGSALHNGWMNEAYPHTDICPNSESVLFGNDVSGEVGGVGVKPRSLCWRLAACADICRLEGEVRECWRSSRLDSTYGGENESWLIGNKRKRVDVCHVFHVVASSTCPRIVSSLAMCPNLAVLLTFPPWVKHTGHLDKHVCASFVYAKFYGKCVKQK